MENEIVNRCPVRTGNLRSTIHQDVDSLYRWIVCGGSQAPYAKFVEARRHFFFGGFELLKNSVRELLVNAVREVLHG